MAGYNSARNTFLDDDDDIDDDEFLRHSRSTGGFILNDSNNDFKYQSDVPVNLEEKRKELLLKKKEIEQRTIMSTEKSLSYLRNSEEVGAATAEELFRQREQLERTEKRLDDINTTLRFSQRHIQGIKSVFGGLKNLIRGKTGSLPPSSKDIPATQPTSSASDNLFEVVDRNNAQKRMVENSSIHPGLRVKGLYDTDENTVLESKAQDVIDRNLDQMLSSIHRLKGLSYTLGDEIESQNDLIEKVIDKTEKADSSIKKQNKDMNKLLK